MDRQQLVEELKNALGHLNNVALLAESPLVALTGNAESPSRGLHLRNLLLDLIEQMKPSSQVAATAPEWRQYTILHDRYVLHRPLWEIEHGLIIGARQVRREHSRAVAILAEMLQTRLAAVKPTPPTEPASTPREAIQRLTPIPRVFELTQLIEEVIDFLEETGKMQNAQVAWRVEPPELTVSTDPGILRQLLTRLALLMLQKSDAEVHAVSTRPGATLQFEAFPSDGSVMLLLKVDLIQFDSQQEGFSLCQLLAHTLGTQLHLSGSMERGATALAALTVGIPLPSGSRLLKVLVVDDEQPAIELYSSYLTGLDYWVTGETSAEEAVARALQEQPAAIVLDVMMPGMDGWELLQRLHHSPQLRTIPIIVCSVLDESDLAASLGAAAFLKKPVLRPQLIKALDQVTT